MSSLSFSLRLSLSRYLSVRATILLALVTATLAGTRLGAAETSSAPRPVTIAIVKDGPSWMLDGVDASFRAELRTLTAGRAALTFKAVGELDAAWREDGAAQALDAALADPTVDYVFALGVRATAAAASAGRALNKPVLGALVQESDLVALPIGPDGRTQKENFAVVALPSRAAEQLQALQPLVPFKTVHVLIDEFLAPHGNALAAWREQLSGALNAPVTLVPVGERAADTLTRLDGSDARVVFLFPAVRMDGSNRAALLQGLSARKFPVLSFLGQPEVELGALAGALPNPRTALVRRAAINLDQLIAGAPVSSLPLRISLPPQLFFNATTATAIGFGVDFNALNQATVIGQFASAGGEPLTFTTAVATALERNFDYRARQSATEAARQSTRSAFGTLLPQLTGNQSFQQIDRDRAEASGGSQPETVQRAGVGLSQIIVNDEAFTRLRISREAQRGASYQEQAERLDTIYDAGQAYLKLLSAQVSLRVSEENLKVTERNLELARLRQRVGTSGPEEGYRFESLAAQQRSDFATAQSQVEQARVSLNRILAVDIETRWIASDVTLEDPAFAFMTSRVVSLVRDQRRLERFRSFAAAYAAEHSPDLLAIEQSVKTQRLTADERKRRVFMPKVSASVNYSRTVNQDLAGPTLAEQFTAAGLPVHSVTADRNDVTVGVTASMPIFTGGSLTAEARESRAELRQAELSRDGARDSIMAQAQAAIYATEAAYTNIALSRRAADLAGQNLDVVQDKYERGTVSIVTLLDAQNSAFAQRQSADAAGYKFLSELLRFQRAIGWIEALATPEEKDAWLRRAEDALNR